MHLADLNADAAEAVAREINAAGASAVPHTVDVTRPEEAEALADAVFEAEHHVDTLNSPTRAEDHRTLPTRGVCQAATTAARRTAFPARLSR